MVERPEAQHRTERSVLPLAEISCVGLGDRLQLDSGLRDLLLPDFEQFRRKVGQNDPVAALGQPDRVTAWSATDVEDPLIAAKVPSQCPLSEFPLDNSICWVVEAIPLALAESCVVRANALHSGRVSIGLRHSRSSPP
jgi:hypothetical protein